MFYKLPYDIKFKIMSYYPLVSNTKKKINKEIILYHVKLDVKKVLDDIIKNVINNLN